MADFLLASIIFVSQPTDKFRNNQQKTVLGVKLSLLQGSLSLVLAFRVDTISIRTVLGLEVI